MGYIYKITNTVNGKIYVGQTTRSIKKRWEEHCREAKYTEYPLHRAIKKYGKDNFTYRMIERCKNENLNDREIYWIDKLCAKTKGYNATNGGDGYHPNDNKWVVDLWNEGKTLKEIREITGYSLHCIDDSLSIIPNIKEQRKQRKIISYKRSMSANGFRVKRKTTAKPIIQLDFEGKIIAFFNSAREYANGNDTVRKCISDCCLGKQKSAYGYKWVFQGGSVV